MVLILFGLCIFVPSYVYGTVLLPSNSVIEKPDTSNISLGPKAPSDLYATSGYGEITLRWTDNSSDEEGFKIERRISDDQFFPIDHVGPNITTYTDKGSIYPLNPNEMYYYRVKAFRGSSESSSNVTNGNWFYTAEPLPVYNFQAEPLKYNESHLKLTWDTPHNVGTSYYLETSVNGGVFLTGKKTLHNDFLNINKNELTVGVPYCYRIKAKNERGVSYSNQVAVTLPPKPVRPTDFQAVPDSNTSVRLTWVDKSDNEEGFIIYRRKLGENYPSQIITGPNVQECVDTGLEPETWYYYVISPFNGNGEVAAESEIVVLTPPYSPGYMNASLLADNTVNLFWSNNSKKMNDVRIERKKDGGQWEPIKTIVIFPPNPAPTGYIDTTAEPGTTYTYRSFAAISAIFVPGSSYQAYDRLPVISDPSNEANVTTKAGTGNVTVGPILTGKKVIRLNLGKTSYTVDDRTLTMDTAPVTSQGRTMLPIKYITDSIGASLAWDKASEKVTIVQGDTTVELWIGRNTARVNGAERMIDSSNPEVRPFIAPPGRTMLPLRFISESLGCQVDWNADLQEASIVY